MIDSFKALIVHATPLRNLLLFAGLTACLVFTVVLYRVWGVLTGKKSSASSFFFAQYPADAYPHIGMPSLYERVRRAHLNCTENLPIFATVVLVGAAISHHSTWFDQLSTYYILARFGQTLMHLLSGSSMVINVRFTFFTTQLICLGLMILDLWGVLPQGGALFAF